MILTKLITTTKKSKFDDLDQFYDKKIAILISIFGNRYVRFVYVYAYERESILLIS